MNPLKIFISSTFVDLKDYRQAAIDVVTRYHCVPLAMEFFGAQSEEPRNVATDQVRDCDLFIGIYAYRYGFDFDGREKSIT